ncbi:MAG: HAD-IA family hydrolase [Akkermansia sp.]|nr:HAD-IA family hydrolase [Akkermansia sp.]
MSERVVMPERRYGGYIFDLDGTLVDSMPTHYRAWRRALAEHGAPPHAFRWREFTAHGGMAAPDIVRDLNRTYGLSMDAEAVAQYKRDCYTRILETESLPQIPETCGLIRRLHEQGIPYAIGTGSLMPGPLETLGAARLHLPFPIIVTPADVPPGCGKPSPHIFLRCAELMGVNPHDCVVFEDGAPGLCAAAAAGMDAVTVGPVPPPPGEV